eukprot:12742047-Prorocentrum_lima.AAC.1
MPCSQERTRSPWVTSPPCSGVSEFARTIRERSGELGWILQTTRPEREYIVALKGKAVQRSIEVTQDDSELRE